MPVVTLTSSYITNADINQGFSNVMVYAVKMEVITDPVTVNQIDFTMTGTHDADVLDYVYLYFNATPTMTGATYLTYTSATFTSGYDYSIPISKARAVGNSGGILITVNVDAIATIFDTVFFEEATNPVSLVCITNPNLVNNQTNSAGVKTISGAAAVTLFNFSGNFYNDKVKLSCETGTENYNKGFQVERSPDGSTSSSIGFVFSKAANENSSITLAYDFTDKHPKSGENYCSLKQLDKDGKYSYSATVLIRKNKDYQNLVKIYPSPLHTTLNVSIASKVIRTLTFEVVDNFGKVIEHRKVSLAKGYNNFRVNVVPLLSGCNLIRFVDDEFRNLTRSFIKY